MPNELSTHEPTPQPASALTPGPSPAITSDSNQRLRAGEGSLNGPVHPWPLEFPPRIMLMLRDFRPEPKPSGAWGYGLVGLASV